MIRQLTRTNPFLVLASDGVWEFLSSQSVVDMVRGGGGAGGRCMVRSMLRGGGAW